MKKKKTLNYKILLLKMSYNKLIFLFNWKQLKSQNQIGVWRTKIGENLTILVSSKM